MKIGSVVIDCNDFGTMSTFWQQALRYVPREPSEDDWVVLRDPNGGNVNVSLQKVPEKRTGKNRLHFDLYTNDQAGEVKRLLEIGATRHSRISDPDEDFVDSRTPKATSSAWSTLVGTRVNDRARSRGDQMSLGSAADRQSAWSRLRGLAGRRLPVDAVMGRWIMAWIGGAALFAANGTIREVVYKNAVGESTSRQLSTASGLTLLTIYFFVLDRRWPIPTHRDAIQIGATWAVLTLLLEFGLGRYVESKSWSELLEDYNIAAGRLWILVPVWTAVGPSVIRSLRTPIRKE